MEYLTCLKASTNNTISFATANKHLNNVEAHLQFFFLSTNLIIIKSAHDFLHKIEYFLFKKKEIPALKQYLGQIPF